MSEKGGGIPRANKVSDETSTPVAPPLYMPLSLMETRFDSQPDVG